MIVNEKTKISDIIKWNKEAIDVIASITPHFHKLKNPILRKLFASQVTVKQAAKIGNTTSTIILNKLKEIHFNVDLPNETPEEANEIPIDSEKLNEDPNVKILDVRPMLNIGMDPFSVLMKEIKALGENQSLMIINSFEPVPLIQILEKKGYKCNTLKYKEEFRTYIKSKKELPEITFPGLENEFSFNDLLNKYQNSLIEVDVRDLEMPYPMITILNKLTELVPGQALLVNHKQIPVFLLPQLEDLKYKFAVEKTEPDHIRMIIYKTNL